MKYQLFIKITNTVFVLVGLILLFGPKHWFPDFYTPIYTGVISLISPLLIAIPSLLLKNDTSARKTLILQIRAVIAVSLMIHVAGKLGLYQLYTVGFQYDKFAHFFVNMMFGYMLCKALKEWRGLSPRTIVWLMVLVVFSFGILWELFEATSDLLFKTREWGIYGTYIAWDTFVDIICNTIGSLAGGILFKIPMRAGNGSRTRVS